MRAMNWRGFAAVLLLFTAPVVAEDAPPDGAGIPDSTAPMLETVVVSGEQPGPGLWRVSDAQGHELWILGSLSPLPKRMRWNPDKVERILERADALLEEPGASISADVGFFGGLALLPAAMKARNNAEGERLEEVLPADLYRRWLVLKERYLGRDRAVEKRRPILAANTLFEKALDRHRLKEDDQVWPVLRKLAKRHDVERVAVRVDIKLSEPKKTLKEFSRTGLDDIDCFETTLARLETDLDGMKARANAWAVGDLETLVALPYPEQDRACSDAVLHSAVVEQQGFSDLRERMRARWMEAAQSALASNQVTLAVLPMRTLVRADGLLAELVALGYTVEPPR
jgi:uncharacterized protein YbaP (TraB family)